jgi:hypothetical protein
MMFWCRQLSLHLFQDDNGVSLAGLHQIAPFNVYEHIIWTTIKMHSVSSKQEVSAGSHSLVSSL